MIVYGIEEKHVLKAECSTTGKDVISDYIRTWGWNEDKLQVEDTLKHLLKKSDKQKKDNCCAYYEVYKLIEKDIAKQSIEGVLSIENNGLDYEEREEWFEVNNQSVESILNLYTGKKIRITIEVL